MILPHRRNQGVSADYCIHILHTLQIEPISSMYSVLLIIGRTTVHAWTESSSFSTYLAILSHLPRHEHATSLIHSGGTPSKGRVMENHKYVVLTGSGMLNSSSAARCCTCSNTARGIAQSNLSTDEATYSSRADDHQSASVVSAVSLGVALDSSWTPSNNKLDFFHKQTK